MEPVPVPPDELSNARFKRGALRSPGHKLLSAPAHIAPPPGVQPLQFAVIPPKLSMWDNDHDGDCVTAEEAFARAVWALMCGKPEAFASDAEVIRWATKYGVLNGATLTEVLDEMIKDGLVIDGVNCKGGPYKTVNYASESTLQSALTVGPVKIAIDANALPGAAGNHNGWSAVGGGHFPNTDHCVSLCGYGTAGYLFGKLGVALPAGLDAAHAGYLLFTWSTIGFVDHAWLMGTCVEAWVRSPTSPPIGPGPDPTPPPLHPCPAGQHWDDAQQKCVDDPTPPPPPPPSQNQVVRYPGGTFPVTVAGPFGRPLHGSVTIPGETLPVVPADGLGAPDWHRIIQAILAGARFLCPLVPLLAQFGVSPAVIAQLKLACSLVPPAGGEWTMADASRKTPCGCP